MAGYSDVGEAMAECAEEISAQTLFPQEVSLPEVGWVPVDHAPLPSTTIVRVA